MEQQAVWHAPHVGPVDRAEGGEGLVPGGAQVGAAGDGLGADRVGGVVVAGQLAVGADRCGALLPFQPGHGVFGNRAEGADRPGRALAAACSPIRSLRASISSAICRA